jgi:hypothetical protein
VRRLLALAAVVLVTLGAAVGVWASRDDGPAEPRCTRTSFDVPDPTTGKVMSYNKTVCEDGP